MKKSALLLGLSVLKRISSHGQTHEPKADVFGGFSYLRSGSENAYGWQMNISGNFTKSLGGVSDIGGQYNKIFGISVSACEYFLGPHGNYRTERVTTFAHAPVGGVTARGSAGGTSVSKTGFALGLCGGVDINLNSRVAIRAIQVDYVADHVGGAWGNNSRVSVGFVFRTGGK